MLLNSCLKINLVLPYMAVFFSLSHADISPENHLHPVVGMQVDAFDQENPAEPSEL